MSQGSNFAARQRAASEALSPRDDFPGWPDGLRISNIPLRRMGGRSMVNNDGCHRSYKHPLAPVAMIDGDSDIELDFLMFAEVDPTVSFVTSQPTQVAFTDASRIRTHFPDFAVIRSGRGEIHECKSTTSLAKADVRAALSAAATHICNWRNWTYFVTDGEALRQSPFRRAVEDLWRHHRCSYDDMQFRAALDAIGTREMRAADLVSALSGLNRPATMENLLSMVAGCRLHADLSGGVNADTLIRQPDSHAMPDSILPCRTPEHV